MRTVSTADTVSSDRSMGRKHAAIRRAGSWVALVPVLLVLAALLISGDSQLTGGDVAHAQSADPPAKPTGLTASSVSHDSVTLTWDDPGDDSITGYQVLRRSRDGNEYGDGQGVAEFVPVVDDTGSTATTYSDTSVSPRTAHIYRVKARKLQRLSEASDAANAETSETPVSQPAQLCEDGYVPPTPTSVAVTAVPIVVASTTADYFVLYASFEVDSTTVDYPVLVKKGEDGATTLAENVAALPADRYRVEKYAVSAPADVDGDCIDDISELDNLGTMNPVNPAAHVASSAVVIPDFETFDRLSFDYDDGDSVIKFLVTGRESEQLQIILWTP